MDCDRQRFPDRHSNILVSNTMYGYGLYESIPSLYESRVAKGVCATISHVPSFDAYCAFESFACGGLRCVSFVSSVTGRISSLPRGRIGMEILGRDTTGNLTATDPRRKFPVSL